MKPRRLQVATATVLQLCVLCAARTCAMTGLARACASPPVNHRLQVLMQPQKVVKENVVVQIKNKLLKNCTLTILARLFSIYIPIFCHILPQTHTFQAS